MGFNKELQSRFELAPELLRGYFTTFFNRDDLYALQRANGAYYRVQQPLEVDTISAHVKGLLTLGVYALDQHYNARWLCFDADEAHPWAALKNMARQLEAEGVIPYLERSRRGGHLWLFMAPLAGQQLRQFGQHLLQKYAVPSVEMYPKQDQLQLDGVGSLVRLPLGIHRKTGQRYPFITPEGQLLAKTLQQQIELLANPLSVPPEYIAGLTTCEHDTPVTQLLPQPRPALQTEKISGEYLSQRIKRSISVYDFVRGYVELDLQGKGCCPFHDDQIRSFQVNVRENYWYCYAGCGGGSVIDFWMKWRAVQGQDAGFKATLKDLARLLF